VYQSTFVSSSPPSYDVLSWMMIQSSTSMNIPKERYNPAIDIDNETSQDDLSYDNQQHDFSDNDDDEEEDHDYIDKCDTSIDDDYESDVSLHDDDDESWIDYFVSTDDDHDLLLAEEEEEDKESVFMSKEEKSSDAENEDLSLCIQGNTCL